MHNMGQENGKWKMENGKWKMENGKWKMENGNFIENENAVNHFNKQLTAILMAKVITFG